MDHVTLNGVTTSDDSTELPSVPTEVNTGTPGETVNSDPLTSDKITLNSGTHETETAEPPQEVKEPTAPSEPRRSPHTRKPPDRLGMGVPSS